MPEKKNPFILAEEARQSMLKDLARSLSTTELYSGWTPEEVAANLGNVLNYSEEKKKAAFDTLAKTGAVGRFTKNPYDPDEVRRVIGSVWTPIKPGDNFDRAKGFLPKDFNFDLVVPEEVKVSRELKDEKAYKEGWTNLKNQWWGEFQSHFSNPDVTGKETTKTDLEKPEMKRKNTLSNRHEKSYWFANRMIVGSQKAAEDGYGLYEGWEPDAVIDNLSSVVNDPNPESKKKRLSVLKDFMPSLWGHLSLEQMEKIIRDNISTKTVPFLPEPKTTQTRTTQPRTTQPKTTPAINRTTTQTTQPEQTPTPTIRRKLSQ